MADAPKTVEVPVPAGRHLVAEKTRAELTPKEWLKHGVQVAEFINKRALRDDVVAGIGPNAGAGHAACFCPSIAEIELNTRAAFVDNVKPAWVGNVNERDTLFDWPKAAGALIHEGSHARWTVWDLVKLGDLARAEKDGRLSGLIEYFEEIRIEFLAGREWPGDLGFLRSSALGIVMDGLDLDELKAGSPYELSRLMILTRGRVLAGILQEDDILSLVSVFEEILDPEGKGLLVEYDRLMRGVLEITDHAGAFEIMIPIAREWLKLLPEPTEEEKAAAAAMMQAIQDMIQEARENAEIGGADDAADQQETEQWQETAAEQNAQAKEQQELEKTSEKIFSKSTAETPDTLTSSRIKERRVPTGKEHAAAVRLAQELERARYRDRIQTETHATVPPGRLQSRAEIMGQAQASTGQVVTARPWKGTRRRHVEDPNLKIGVMCDISGSMRPTMQPMATTAWVLAEAGYRIQAEVAQVYYGNSAFPTLKPGQRMDKVVVRTASDGTERFSIAVKALIGKLDLLHSTGARLLVIVSDTCYTHDEVQALKLWTRRLLDAGVAIIIMTWDESGYHVRDHRLDQRVQVITDRMDAVTAAMTIGQAAIKGLRAVQTA